MTPQKPLANQCRVAEHEKTQSYVEFHLQEPTGSGTEGAMQGRSRLEQQRCGLKYNVHSTRAFHEVSVEFSDRHHNGRLQVLILLY